MIGLGHVGAVAGLLFWQSAVRQPLNFPHSTHVARGIECIDCHSRVDSRAEASLPSIGKCMLCHRSMAAEKLGLKQLRGYAEKRREIPWVRVYGFERDSHVKFQHAPHIRAKLACAECHGAVEKMTVAQPVVKHTMGTCITCHRQRGASTECIACHI